MRKPTGTQNSSSLHPDIIDAFTTSASSSTMEDREGSRRKGEKRQHTGQVFRDIYAGGSWEKGKHLLQDQWLHQGGSEVEFPSLHNFHLKLSHNHPQNLI